MTGCENENDHFDHDHFDHIFRGNNSHFRPFVQSAEKSTPNSLESRGIFYTFAVTTGSEKSNQLLIYRLYFMEVKNILTGLFDRLSGLRIERPTAGTKYRLMGMMADIAEVAQTLQQEVLQRVSQEAVLDVDVDIDFAELAEQVMSWELSPLNPDLQEPTEQVNDALGALNEVLSQIDDQLSRRHKDEEYARLYEQEKRRYMNSGTSKRARQDFEEWKDYTCYGHPLQENIEDYRVEKLLHMFEKGVLNSRVAHCLRAKRYSDEVDFDQLDDDHPLKKTVHKYYFELRKLVDFCDGRLEVDPVRVGRYFYACRHEENAKSHRTNFLKYMHKIDLAQQEAARKPEMAEEPLNFFAPSKNMKALLGGEWFSLLTTDDKRFNRQWTDGFVEALMHSEWGERIAREWAVADKRLTLKCMIVGVLKDIGVIKGSYNQIAKLLDIDEENPATLAKYLGMGKKQPYAEWIEGYVKE